MRSTSTSRKLVYNKPTKLPKISQKSNKPLIQAQLKTTHLVSKPQKNKQLLNAKEPPHFTIFSKPSSKSSMKSNRNDKNLISVRKQPLKNIINETVNTLPNLSESQPKLPTSFPQISWSDFQGHPIENSWFLAQIYWGISYSTRVLETSSKFKVEVTAQCSMNKARSWVKAEYDELLEHEQGHFNIGYLCALAFEKRVSLTIFSPKNYRDEVRRIFDETMREFCDLERRYDEETNHMLNTEMQMKWNQDLLERLNRLTNLRE